MPDTTPFNPHEHLIQLTNKKGATDYLPVQWRLVWFREQNPEGTIDTEEVQVDLDREVEVETYAWSNEKRRSEKVLKRARGYARFKAVVTDGKGGRATGTKSENAANFPDYVEKAETGAIGRALAALGYGTQFAPELDEEHRIVDSPVDRQDGGSIPSSTDNQATKNITAKASVQSSAPIEPAQSVTPPDPQPAPAQTKSVKQEKVIDVDAIKQKLLALTNRYRTDQGKHTPVTHMLNAIRISEGHLPDKQANWTPAHYQQALTITEKWMRAVTPEQTTEVRQFESLMGLSFVEDLSYRLGHSLPAELAYGPMEVLLRELRNCLFLFELAAQVDLGPNNKEWNHLLTTFKEQSLLDLIRVKDGRVDRSDLDIYQRYITEEYHRRQVVLSEPFMTKYSTKIQELLAA